MRWEYRQPKGTTIAIEPREGALWLWLDLHGDKRCLGLEGDVTAILAAVHARQDDISTDNYLSHYGELGSVCSVSIIAWEQFEPAPKKTVKSWKK
jgi:hypothetical protein